MSWNNTHNKNDGFGLVHKFCVVCNNETSLCAVALEHLLHKLGCRMSAISHTYLNR